MALEYLRSEDMLAPFTPSLFLPHLQMNEDYSIVIHTLHPTKLMLPWRYLKFFFILKKMFQKTFTV